MLFWGPRVFPHSPPAGNPEIGSTKGKRDGTPPVELRFYSSDSFYFSVTMKYAGVVCPRPNQALFQRRQLRCLCDPLVFIGLRYTRQIGCVFHPDDCESSDKSSNTRKSVFREKVLILPKYVHGSWMTESGQSPPTLRPLDAYSSSVRASPVFEYCTTIARRRGPPPSRRHRWMTTHRYISARYSVIKTALTNTSIDWLID